MDLCKFGLFRLTKSRESSEILTKNIHLGNALIRNPFQTHVKRKDDLSLANDMFYDRDLGVPDEFILRRYDLVVGNPPWERIRPDERDFFAALAPTLARTPKKNDHLRGLKQLNQTNPTLFQYYSKYVAQINAFRELIRKGGDFPLSAKGELNTYALFTELCMNCRSDRGIVGDFCRQCSPATAPVNRHFFNHMVTNKLLLNVFDFVNSFTDLQY